MKTDIFPMLLRVAGLPVQWLDRLAVGWELLLAAEKQREEAEKSFKNHCAELQGALDAAVNQTAEGPTRTALYNIRKRFFQKGSFSSGSKAVLEIAAPDLKEAYEAWERVGAELEYARENEILIYQKSLTFQYELIQGIAQSETLQRGLLFASHDLLKQIPDFLKVDPSNFDKKHRQTAISIARYATRAAAKTSPLSRFTTVSVWTEEVPEFSSDKIAVTPNVGLLKLFYEVLVREPAFYESISIRLNPSIPSDYQEDDAVNWLVLNSHEEIQQHSTEPAIQLAVRLLFEQGEEVSWKKLIQVLEENLDANQETLNDFALNLVKIGLLEWVWPEKGLSSNWASGLYQWLGFLPSTPVIVETAAVLQWLRQTARTLAYTPVEAAMEQLQSTYNALKDYCDQFGVAREALPSPEQLFWEDVERSAKSAIPLSALREIIEQLVQDWTQMAKPKRYGLAAAIQENGINGLQEGENTKFLNLRNKNVTGRPVSISGFSMPYKEKIGGLFQFFYSEGVWRAVVNGLFPGGGKMVARWMHILPQRFNSQLGEWFPEQSVLFPWQGWHNAGFQPLFGTAAIWVPGGRVEASGIRLRLGDLLVERRNDELIIVDQSGTPVTCLDLGLENPAVRPYTMQLLHALTVPVVTVDALRSSEGPQKISDGWYFYPRLERGKLIYRRSTWFAETKEWKVWIEESDFEFFQAFRRKASEVGLPRRFFFNFAGEKPQYCDMSSALMLIIFEKALKTASSTGVLIFTEMLPLPEHWDNNFVQEQVIECF